MTRQLARATLSLSLQALDVVRHLGGPVTAFARYGLVLGYLGTIINQAEKMPRPFVIASTVNLALEAFMGIHACGPVNSDTHVLVESVAQVACLYTLCTTSLSVAHPDQFAVNPAHANVAAATLALTAATIASRVTRYFWPFEEFDGPFVEFDGPARG